MLSTGVLRTYSVFQVHLLSVLCRDQAKERYSRTVEQLASASRQIGDEVVSMEVDILVGKSMAELLEKNRLEMERSIKDLQLEATIAAGEWAANLLLLLLLLLLLYLLTILSLGSSSSGSASSDPDSSNLLSAASHLKDISSKMVQL